MEDPRIASTDDFEDDPPPTQKTPKNACKSLVISEMHAPDHLTDPAVSELMKPHSPQPKDKQTQRTKLHGRDGLGAYIADPASFPQSRVVYYDENFVVINDLYPKAFIHMLILPRDKQKYYLRPQEAFDDPVFLALCREEEKKVRALVASELQRQLGKHSALDSARLQAMDLDDPPDELPVGRDWDKEVMSGTHANPSMNHLHIHVLSRDMHSEPMRKYNHYQSFNTDFFIGLDQFPLANDDHRRVYKKFQTEMICWRCGKNFGNQMAKLKRHLEEEFEQWRRE